MDSIADGFFAFDREWRITHVNDAALRHFRKTREEMVGRGFFEVFPAARGTVYEAEYRRSMESGEPVHFEAPSTLSDRMMELHAYPGPDNMTILFRDVTERNRMAAALREAHERAAWLARFPEENPNPVTRVSSEGNVLYRNPAAAQLPGWACEVGQPLPAPLLPLVGQAMTEKQEAELEVELGGRFYSVSVSPSPGERYVNVYGRDITERKRAEEALRESEQRLRFHIENSPLAVVEWDANFIVSRWSKEAERVYGWNADEVIGKRIDTLNLVYQEDLPIVERTMARLTGGKERTVVSSNRNYTKSGAVIEAVWYNSVLLDAQGTMSSVLSLVLDVTERKRMEDDLRRSRDDLEMRVQERTEELERSHQRLQELASQLLQAQEKERKRIAIELHDSLLSELAAMKYLFEAKVMRLKKGELADPNDFNRVTEIMQKVIKDARGIMNNLRPSILDEMGLIPTIQWLSEEYQKAYSHIQIRKQVEVLEKDIPEVLKVVIFRVLQEALNNFAKHGRGNLVELSLLKSGDTLHFGIRDNGQGFDAGNVQKGLGLESMRERVEISGGSYQMESAVGKGTTIRASWSLGGKG